MRHSATELQLGPDAHADTSGVDSWSIGKVAMNPDPHESAAPLRSEARRHYEQRLMRIGRRLQALGQLLEQDPTRLVGKGFEFDASVVGAHPVQIEMDELREVFDRSAEVNVGRLLAEYQALLAGES